ncbi:MAG: hypothetical protein ABF263_02840 [Polaribacter sp.]
MKSLRNICILCCIFLSISCSKNLDFNQLDDYTNNPEFISSITYFTLDSNNFIPNAGTPNVTEITEQFDFRIFENTFIKNNLIKLDFMVEVNNQFNSDFTIEISLLNDNNNLIYKLNDFKIAANDTDFNQIESIDVLINQNVKNFTRIELKISLDDTTTPITASDLGTFEFKSAAKVYLETSL